MENRDDRLLEPISYYKTYLKDKVHDQAIKCFDKLAAESKMDIYANKETVKEYDSECVVLSNLKKKLNGKKTLKGFNIAGIIIFMVVAALFITYTIVGGGPALPLGLSVSIPCLLVGIGLILVLVLVVNKRVAHFAELKELKEQDVNELYTEAINQMAKLNSLYDYGIAYEIFDEAVDIVNFDKFFSRERLAYMIENCDYPYEDDEDVSTLYCKSGEILGNPFFIRKIKTHWIGSKAYHGSRIVTYTKSYTDSDGHYRTRTVTETLHATVYKPHPEYGATTQLIYGNQAGDRLTFSRTNPGLEVFEEGSKKKDKFLYKKSVELDKLSQNSLGSGGTFTPLSNTEFEVYFNALDRDNEVQFNLLFTPLAQKNMLNLLFSPEGYGDDFIFMKRKRFNLIQSAHIQRADLTCDPANFYSHSHDIAKQKFVNYIDSFFKNLYFDFAPLLSIPLYQQLKTKEYIYNIPYTSNTTMFEAEMIANKFDASTYAHEETATELILKATFDRKVGKTDIVNIEAHSYKGIPRMDIVPVMAGNGHLYDVPVHWTEYVPVSKITPTEVKHLDTTRPKFVENLSGSFGDYIFKNIRNYTYFDRIFAFVDRDNFNETDDSNLDRMYNSK